MLSLRLYLPSMLYTFQSKLDWREYTSLCNVLARIEIYTVFSMENIPAWVKLHSAVSA